MAIRNSITAMRTAILGTLAFDGPQRAVALVLDTTTEANNVFGRALRTKPKTQQPLVALAYSLEL